MENIYLEEKAFPELFPFGDGGYLSSLLNSKETDMGFAMYIKHRILSSDPKFRKNSTYLFFLLIVKELVQLKGCKQTYMRQATKLPNLTKETMKNVNRQDLSRYNRSYEVFKAMRGTSMYYEEAKKNVMAILRQNGSPSLFVTLSCAEYSWNSLLKEILETVKNREVTEDEVQKLSVQEKNKLVSENVVQSTLHFQKRIEKILKLTTHTGFLATEINYGVSSYYYRVEFQQRGAPHIHYLLWLQDSDDNPAPTFWSTDDEDQNQEEKIRNIERIASSLISASEDFALCDDHYNELQSLKGDYKKKECKDCFFPKYGFEECPKHKIMVPTGDNCEGCKELKKNVKDFQSHKHTFSCQKKNKLITIKETEGHGKNDKTLRGPKITNYVQCRYNFPQFPMNKTTFILGMTKDLPLDEKESRKKDLLKIRKFLIRKTHSEDSSLEESFELKQFNNLSFIQFLHKVGMFSEDKNLETYTKEEKKFAYERYLNALSASIRGTGSIFLKRNTKDILTNNFNRRLMGVHQANHDIQIVVDQVCCPVK